MKALALKTYTSLDGVHNRRTHTFLRTCLFRLCAKWHFELRILKACAMLDRQTEKGTQFHFNREGQFLISAPTLKLVNQLYT